MFFLWFIPLLVAPLTVICKAVGSQQSSNYFAAVSLVDSWTPPLSTRGRYIVDAKGKRFKLKGGNWHGASGTYLGSGNINDPKNHHAGEIAYQTPLALDRAPISEIINSFLQLGVNSIRLPFSNQMIHTTDRVPDSAMAANPQFKGKTPIQIYDQVITALTNAGIAVILNNHVVKSIWCCGLDNNARWNVAQSDDTWQSDWLLMVNRYKSNPRVVGADLYNEVRRDFLTDPTWGDGTSSDWYQAAFDLGARIHREGNPDILVIIEGINFVGVPISTLPHYRPELQPVVYLSHALPVPNKLIYQSHFYAYTGANQTGAGSTDDPSYGALSVADLTKTFNYLAGYVNTPIDQPQQHYTAPVWIGEFGSAGRSETNTQSRNWWKNFGDILIQQDVDYAYWPLVGFHENGQGDGWALNQWDHLGNRINIISPSGDWRLTTYSALQNSTTAKEGTISSVPIFRMLSADNKPAHLSMKIPSTWAPSGSIAAACPDGLRLLGLSNRNHPRALCGNPTFGSIDTKTGQGGYEVVTTEKYVVQGRDWASGYTKLQCPPGAFLVGHSFALFQSVAALCAFPSKDISGGKPIGNTTIYFDKGVSQGTLTHGDFNYNASKGVCADNELAIGYAFKSSSQGKWPSVLMCQNYGGQSNIVIGNHALSLRMGSRGLFWSALSLFVSVTITFAL